CRIFKQINSFLKQVQIRPFRKNRSILEHHNLIGCFDVLQLVSNQDDTLVCKVFLDALLKQILCNRSIDRRQWVIEEVTVSVGVESTGQTDTSPLSTAQRSASIVNIGHVTLGKLLKVRL